MPRRFNLLLLITLLTIFLGTSLYYSAPLRNNIYKNKPIYPPTAPPGSPEEPLSHSHIDSDHPDPDTPLKNSGSLSVAVTETGGSHDEVVAALVHSFGSQPNVDLTLYQILPRFGIQEIMDAFELPKKIPDLVHPMAFLSDKESEPVLPDFWVSSTCEIDIPYYREKLTMLLENRKTYIFCIIHHSDRWDDDTDLAELVAPWVDAGRIEFLTLSPHTQDFLQKVTSTKWTRTKAQALVRYFVPVFPVTLPLEQVKIPEGEVPKFDPKTEELGFALQGDYDSSRRNYEGMFQRLAGFLETATTEQGKNLTMHLIGHGDHPDVPEAVQDHVEFDEHLSYIEYYTLASRMFAMLPAFASKEYLDRKASSSVPASLIAGVPLVASQGVIDAYAYLNAETVWLETDGVIDIDVVGQILELGTEARSRKKQRVRERRDEIIKGNAKRVGEWISEALGRLGRPA